MSILLMEKYKIEYLSDLPGKKKEEKKNTIHIYIYIKKKDIPCIICTAVFILRFTYNCCLINGKEENDKKRLFCLFFER